MAKNMTRVSVAKLLKVCQKVGLVVVEQPSQYRVECPTDKTKRMYFGKGKKGATLVDISGFTSPHAIVHPKPPTSKVTQQLDFSLTEAEILRNFYKTACLIKAVVVAPKEPTKEQIMNDSPAV
jgi:hypothetical protein